MLAVTINFIKEGNMANRPKASRGQPLLAPGLGWDQLPPRLVPRHTPHKLQDIVPLATGGRWIPAIDDQLGGVGAFFLRYPNPQTLIFILIFPLKLGYSTPKILIKNLIFPYFRTKP